MKKSLFFSLQMTSFTHPKNKYQPGAVPATFQLFVMRDIKIKKSIQPFFFAVLFILSKGRVFAQDCKYTKNEVDAVTSQVVRTVDVEVGDDPVDKGNPGMYQSYGTNGKKVSYYFILGAERNGSKYYLRYEVTKWGRNLESITPADTQYFKFTTGELLKLTPETANPEFRGGTRYIVSIPVTLEQLNNFQNLELAHIRLGMPSKPNFVVSPKKAKRLQAAIRCLTI